MEKIRDKLKGKKTYILGVVGVIGVIASYLVGDIELGKAVEAAWVLIMGMTIRAGVATEITKATEE